MLPTTNFPGAWEVHFKLPTKPCPNQKNGSAGHFWVATQQLRNTDFNKIPVNFDPHRSSSSGAPCPTPRDIWTDVGRSIRRRAAARRRSQRRPPLSPPPRSAADNNTHTDTEKVRGGGYPHHPNVGKLRVQWRRGLLHAGTHNGERKLKVKRSKEVLNR